MMMGSLVKGHIEKFFADFAHPGYEFEFDSSGATLRNVELNPKFILPSSLPIFVVSGCVVVMMFGGRHRFV